MNGILNEKNSAVVKDYEFHKPDVLERDFLLDEFIKHCRKKYFHTFEFRLVYDINFTNLSKNKEENLTVTSRSIEYKNYFYGLNKIIRNTGRNGFIFNQLNKPEKIF